jgi:KUP system potassium uptake protein
VQEETQSDKSFRSALVIAALGIVFGDIGTSPLYVVRETLAPGYGISLSSETILGALSAVFWVLIVVVTLKYVVLVMRANNRGEGGTMALIALATSAVKERPRLQTCVLLLGLFGASLFFGEAVLTPAISVLSAIEGLHVGTDIFDLWVLPLFAVQSRGTEKVGALFGPVCLLWFVAIASAGIWNVLLNPIVIEALDPRYALAYLTGHGFPSFAVLGAVLLAFTGAEALYADMGQLGKWPIRTAWFSLVLPALVLNYFGQGALLIAHPEAIRNPFYLAFPVWALYPMVALATAATVIASQATITGACSLTRQAIRLGFLPRMNIVHTSARVYGQIYIPFMNWALLALVIFAVLGFGSSTRLASAYGVAVTGTMTVTTVLTFFVIRFGWGYPIALSVLASGFFFVIDVAFFSSALLKLLYGGWFPLAIGIVMFTLMLTWWRGRQALLLQLRASSAPLGPFLDSFFLEPPNRVPGTAVFITPTPEVTPHALLHNLKHNKVLHESVVFLTVEFLDIPWQPFDERVEVEWLGHGCFRVKVRYGFMNQLDVVQALEIARSQGLRFDMEETSFFVSRDKIVPRGDEGAAMALWRERLFAAMARNASSITDYFNIPPNRVIEVGTRIEV